MDVSWQVYLYFTEETSNAIILSTKFHMEFEDGISEIYSLIHILVNVHHVANGRKYNVVSRIEAGKFSGTLELQRAIPVLKKAYSDGLHKMLHIGPASCSVVSKLLKEDDLEAWGVEPYDLEDADSNCKNLVQKGIVRVADIKFPLPYRSQSFSLVIVPHALDYLSSKYLNKTLPELARVSADGFVIFTGYPGQQRARVTELSDDRQKCVASPGGHVSSIRWAWR